MLVGGWHWLIQPVSLFKDDCRQTAWSAHHGKLENKSKGERLFPREHPQQRSDSNMEAWAVVLLVVILLALLLSGLYLVLRLYFPAHLAAFFTIGEEKQVLTQNQPARNPYTVRALNLIQIELSYSLILFEV